MIKLTKLCLMRYDSSNLHIGRVPSHLEREGPWIGGSTGISLHWYWNGRLLVGVKVDRDTRLVGPIVLLLIWSTRNVVPSYKIQIIGTVLKMAAMAFTYRPVAQC